MGLFNLFKKKPASQETKQNFVRNIYDKYFNGSIDKLREDASELLGVTKYNLTQEVMSGMIIRCLGFRELKRGWDDLTRNALRKDCSGKLSDIELKWLMVYCDVHYIKKSSREEMMLIAEVGGRQIGMPSPLGNISATYHF